MNWARGLFRFSLLIVIVIVMGLIGFGIYQGWFFITGTQGTP